MVRFLAVGAAGREIKNCLQKEEEHGVEEQK